MTVRELARRPLVVPRRGYDLREVTLQAFADAGVTPRFAVEGGEMDAVLRLVEAGTGVAVVPDLVFAGRPRLRRTVLTPPLYRTVALARRADLAPTHAVRAFCETLLEFLAELSEVGGPVGDVQVLATRRWSDSGAIASARAAGPQPRRRRQSSSSARRARRRRRRARRAPRGRPGRRCRRRSPCGRASRPAAGRPSPAAPRCRRPSSAACGRPARGPGGLPTRCRPRPAPPSRPRRRRPCGAAPRRSLAGRARGRCAGSAPTARRRRRRRSARPRRTGRAPLTPPRRARPCAPAPGPAPGGYGRGR